MVWIEPVRRRRGDVEPEPDFTLESTLGSAVVDIASVDREDEGTYRCVATNTGGTTEVLVQLTGKLFTEHLEHATLITKWRNSRLVLIHWTVPHGKSCFLPYLQGQ